MSRFFRIINNIISSPASDTISIGPPANMKTVRTDLYSSQAQDIIRKKHSHKKPRYGEDVLFMFDFYSIFYHSQIPLTSKQAKEDSS